MSSGRAWKHGRAAYLHPPGGGHVRTFIQILNEEELMLYIIKSVPVNIQFELCKIHTGPLAGEGRSVGIQLNIVLLVCGRSKMSSVISKATIYQHMKAQKHRFFKCSGLL